MTQPPPQRAPAPQVLFAGSGGRALLFDLGQGEGLPPHSHRDQGVVLAVLLGQVRFEVDGHPQQLSAGEHVATRGETFSMQALEPSRVLVALIADAPN